MQHAPSKAHASRPASSTTKSSSPSKAAKNAGPSAVECEEAAAKWSKLGLETALCDRVVSLGWLSPTEVQQCALPPALQRRDVVALARTGSGKTGAFALPIIQSLLATSGNKAFYALALAPTRELCMQIADSFAALGGKKKRRFGGGGGGGCKGDGLELKTCCLVGGLDMVVQAQQLAQRPHVVVASPGRLVDHMEQTRGVRFDLAQWLVLDEADRLLELNFEEDLHKVMKAMGDPGRRTTLLFSATMTRKVSKLRAVALKKTVVEVACATKHDVAPGLTQFVVPCKETQRLCALVVAVQRAKAGSGIIFVETCEGAQRLASVMRHLGFVNTHALHGKMSQPERLGALHAFRDRQVAPESAGTGEGNVAGAAATYLVATDVAARGLDIPHVEVVFNYDLPVKPSEFVHRVGRTARAGREGLAIAFASVHSYPKLEAVESFLKTRLEPWGEVTADKMVAIGERVAEAAAYVDRKAREAGDNGRLKREAGKLVRRAAGKAAKQRRK